MAYLDFEQLFHDIENLFQNLIVITLYLTFLCYHCFMNKEEIKLEKLKKEQSIISKKKKLLNSYISDSKNFNEKISALRLKHEVDRSSFISSFKTLMKKK